MFDVSKAHLSRISTFLIITRAMDYRDEQFAIVGGGGSRVEANSCCSFNLGIFLAIAQELPRVTFRKYYYHTRLLILQLENANSVLVQQSLRRRLSLEPLESREYIFIRRQNKSAWVALPSLHNDNNIIMNDSRSHVRLQY